ncbi:RsmE family RNA methyltransferase [Alicyclobacillus sp.]|uniref:RsmE family RNA methyltransferase n=1 Tax=Alicyclobacillus sp. TaxID=61169 RepID=UPI0025BF324A|nr:RsmE family RNA methyltransferase [Alicyclobacillus sp.]
MPRVFVDEPITPGARHTVGGEDGHHYARVLRVRRGEVLAVASGGRAYRCEVAAVDARAGRVDIVVGDPLPPAEPRRPVFLLQGLAKGDKIESVIQHNTEAGAAGFCVLAAARSVVRLDARRAEERCVRWRRVAREAAAQAQRDIVPEVGFAGQLDQAMAWLSARGVARVLLLDELESARGFRQALEEASAGEGGGAAIAVAVGPEGGWDDRERTRFLELGAVAVTLGPRILRTETAGLAAVSAILYHDGEFRR